MAGWIFSPIPTPLQSATQEKYNENLWKSKSKVSPFFIPFWSSIIRFISVYEYGQAVTCIVQRTDLNPFTHLWHCLFIPLRIKNRLSLFGGLPVTEKSVKKCPLKVPYSGGAAIIVACVYTKQFLLFQLTFNVAHNHHQSQTCLGLSKRETTTQKVRHRDHRTLLQFCICVCSVNSEQLGTLMKSVLDSWKTPE